MHPVDTLPAYEWPAQTVLILGGTAEARTLCAILQPKARHTILSLAGLTATPNTQTATELITGGFGGLEGLKAFLHDRAITVLLDASHPFATTISQTAQAAARTLNIPYIRVDRAPWHPDAADNWRMVANVKDAIRTWQTLKATATLVCLGARHVDAFRTLPTPDRGLIFRTVDPLPETITGITNCVAKGPFSHAQEQALFKSHDIDCIICKNSGGTWARAKLDVARQYSIPVIMIDRPSQPISYGLHQSFEEVQAALNRT